MAKQSDISNGVVGAVKVHVPCFLDVAQAEGMPYSVYEIEEVPSRDKRGIYKWVASVTVYIIHNDFEALEVLLENVIDSIDGLKSKTLIPIMNSKKHGTEDGSEWAYKIDYTITQFI